MSSALWIALAVVGCAALLYASYRIEPHWVAKDGQRFLATATFVDRAGTEVGRRREVRGTLMDDRTVLIGRRTLWRTRSAVYRLRDKWPQPARGRQQYVLEPFPLVPGSDLLVLRIPPTSRLTATFDAMLRPSPEEA